MTISAAEVAQVSSYCLPQFDLATARGITQQVRALLRQNLLAQAFPNSNRELIHGRQSREECDGWRAANADIEWRASARMGTEGISTGDTRVTFGPSSGRHPGRREKSRW